MTNGKRAICTTAAALSIGWVASAGLAQSGTQPSAQDAAAAFGARENLQGSSQSRLMADRLRDAKATVEYVEFDGLDHYLDDAAARTRLLSQSDAFLRKAIKM